MFEFQPVSFDLDGDGIPDLEAVVADTDGDGVMDVIGIDTTGDGVLDTTFAMVDDSTMAMITLNDDGVPITTMMMDTDNNGVVDTMVTFEDRDMDGNPEFLVREYDYDQDGVIDSRTIYEDTDGDGNIDKVIKAWDADGDGQMDHSRTSYDFDGDHRADLVVEEVRTYENGELMSIHSRIDSNGDGIFDAENIETANGDRAFFFDSDEDGVIDSGMIETADGETTHLHNTIGDGAFDEAYTITADGETPYYQDIATSAAASVEDVINPAISGMYVDELQRFDPGTASADTTLGDPSSSMDVWECQGDTNRCAVFAQKFVIEELTGQDIPADELAALAEENNWFSEESGTPLLSMNKLLDHFGIENEVSYHNTGDDLREALASGSKVITCIDADEIWYGEENDIFSPTDGPNHAVEIIGIDESDPDHPMVILNDSGHENGCGEMVPMDVFLGAWEDGNCMMITC